MSNINNKHIPEDLDSLTRKDMVELFKIQIEEHQGFIKEIESLREQLAKANKRENRLEKILQRYESEQLQPLKLRVKELEECVIKFRQGVTHFNRTRGDLNVLLSAYADCEKLRKEQSND